MNWWQGVLFIAGCVAAGLLLGIPLGRFILKIRYQHRPVYDSPPAAPPQQAWSNLDILAEAEDNLAIATRRWAGQLVAFQTEAWDRATNRVYSLPDTIRENLTQAYVDIRLANNIVWLSTDLDRRSTDLDGSYLQLCGKIAARLKEAVTAAKQAG